MLKSVKLKNMYFRITSTKWVTLVKLSYCLFDSKAYRMLRDHYIVTEFLSAPNASRSPFLLPHNGCNLDITFYLRGGVFAATAFSTVQRGRPTLSSQIFDDTLESVRHTVSSFKQGVKSYAECTAKHPKDTHGYPASKELFAENISRAIHGHRP